jgi:hypothetical protein
MQDSPPAGPTSLRCRKAPSLGVDVSCVNVLVSVPSDMSHRIVVVDRDLAVIHRRLDSYGSGAHRGCVHARYLSTELHGCPCGYAGDPEKECTCGPRLISRYQKRPSGPRMDLIDLHVEAPRVRHIRTIAAAHALAFVYPLGYYVVMIEIRQTEVCANWFDELRDRQARARIDVRIRRLSLGNRAMLGR